MNATGVAVVVSSVIAVLVIGVVTLQWRRRGRRRNESAAERYRREVGSLHPAPQTWRAQRKAAGKQSARRRRAWAAGAAGAAGAVGVDASELGGGTADSGFGCGGSGCGGGGGCGGGT